MVMVAGRWWDYESTGCRDVLTLSAFFFPSARRFFRLFLRRQSSLATSAQERYKKMAIEIVSSIWREEIGYSYSLSIWREEIGNRNRLVELAGRNRQ
jgi:hypothetical protein